MNLVDLDRLKWPDIAIFDMNLHGECAPMVRLSDLQTLPPLEDVVPVEWLRQEAMKDDGLINSVIRGLLAKWQKEQEAGR